MPKKTAATKPTTSVLMPEYQRASFRVVGLSPLVQHNPAGSMQPAGQGPKKKTDIPAPEVEAEAGTYRLAGGQLYVKTEAFQGAIRKASLNTKIGKTKAQQVFAAGLFLIDEACPLVHPDTGKPIHNYKIDIRRAVIQGKGVMRARPLIFAWATTVTFEYDPDLLAPETILDYLRLAGKIAGVGDQRPGAPKTPGPYGRFAAELLNAEP